MDKKLLEMLRKIYSLDIATLPDSITPEECGKVIEEQAGKFVKQEDIKALQKKLSEKDLELKKLEEGNGKKKGEEDEKDKLIREMGENIQKLTNESESKKLKEAYPDISTKVLLGKTEEEQKAIAEEQRAINAETYGDLPSAHEPIFNDISEIDKEMERVKNDKEMDTDAKLAKIGELKEKKAEM
jgi:hypothetical protein